MFESQRPTRPIRVFSNFFHVQFNKTVMKYLIEITGKVAISSPQIQDIVKSHITKHPANLALLRSILGTNFAILSSVIYSTQIHPSEIKLEVSEEDPIVEKITVMQTTTLDQQLDTIVIEGLLGRFFKIIMRKLRLMQIGRKMFDPLQSQSFDTFEIWPGFSTSLMIKATHAMFNIDMVSKIITNKTVLDLMSEIRNKGSNNLEESLNSALVGKSVMTVYNRRFYVISRVVLEKSPESVFLDNEKKEVRFCDYYLAKYQKKIGQMSQPLLSSIDKKTGVEILLVPELCVVTGLNDEQRANRNLMTNLDKFTKPEPSARLKRSIDLLKTIATNPASSDFINEWKIGISNDPIPVDGLHIEAGCLLFAKDFMVDIEKSQNLDRDMQQKFYDGKSFEKLLIFYPKICTQEFQSFYEMTGTVLQSISMDCKNVEGIEIQDFRTFEAIKPYIHKHLNQSVTACIWILPGRKKAGLHYDKIKKMLVNNFPVPSQVVLASTIAAGKNFRSIVTKIFVQICAKIGGIPWAINDLPFRDKPCIVIGLNNYVRSNNKFGVYSMVATMNNSMSTYWSESGFGSQDFTIDQFIASAFPRALAKFKNDISVLPGYIIFFREGVSKGQHKTVRDTEIEAVKNVIKTVYENEKSESRLMFMVSSKTSNAKFFFNPSNNNDLTRLQNPLPGTYLHANITEDEREFFLLPQKTFRGLGSPTNFVILENQLTDIDKVDYACVRELLAKLVYKLCYLYYNTTGSIKVPAPIHYAVKLGYLVGDKSTPHEPIIPHQYLGAIKSLYFI